MLPISLLGPFAGALTDTLDRRKFLNLLQFLLACCALFTALSIYQGFVTYKLIAFMSLLVGTVGCAEMPTRQSLVSLVVPADELQEAIPINNMTFNIARLIGPAIGGYLLTEFGPAPCYLVNGLSFFCLIGGVQMIKADLSAKSRTTQPIMDLLLEGMRYTFRDVRMRTLFFLEALVAALGLAYLPLIPAIADKILHLDKRGLANCYVAVGVGALSALILMVKVKDREIKAQLIYGAMLIMGTGLILLSVTDKVYFAYPLFSVLGCASILQFNLTNTLFQTLSPPALRGRVLSMHVWALGGLGPFGVLFLGNVAKAAGIGQAIALGGICVLLGGLYAWYSPSWKKDLESRPFLEESVP